MCMFNVWLTCREHLLVEARGSDRYMKVSNVRDLRWQVRHCTVDLNWPWNSATMMDSFSSLCLLQARSAAVWSSRWSFSSSLYRFLLSAWHRRREKQRDWYTGTAAALGVSKTSLHGPTKSQWLTADTEYTGHNYNIAISTEKNRTQWGIQTEFLSDKLCIPHLTSLSFSCSSASSLSLW